mgnify:CR=1 FL=1
MSSTKTHKAHSSQDKIQAISKKDAAPKVIKKAWNDIHSFLDDAEARVLAFGKLLDTKADDLDASARVTADEFEGLLHEGLNWFNDQIALIRDTEGKTETALENAKVRIHLAKMDAKDKATDLLARLTRFKSELDALMKRTERESSAKLKHFSDQCHDLKKILQS